MVQEEFPNRLVPNGARRGLTDLLQGAESGKALLASVRYDVLNEIAQGDSVVLEVQWSATIGADRGPFKQGQQLRARFCCVFQFRDGKVIAQRNYDCFEPF